MRKPLQTLQRAWRDPWRDLASPVEEEFVHIISSKLALLASEKEDISLDFGDRLHRIKLAGTCLSCLVLFEVKSCLQEVSYFRGLLGKAMLEQHHLTLPIFAGIFVLHLDSLGHMVTTKCSISARPWVGHEPSLCHLVLCLASAGHCKTSGEGCMGEEVGIRGCSLPAE